MNKKLIITGLTIMVIILIMTIGFYGFLINDSKGIINPPLTIDNLSYRQYGFGINPPEPSKVCCMSQTLGEEPHWHIVNSITNFDVEFLCPETECGTIIGYESFSNLDIPARLSIQRMWFDLNSTYVPRYLFDDKPFDEFASEYIKTITHLYNVTFLSNISTTINDMEAYEVVYTYDWNGTQYIKKYILVEKYEAVFELIYTATESYYDKYIEVVDGK